MFFIYIFRILISEYRICHILITYETPTKLSGHLSNVEYSLDKTFLSEHDFDCKVRCKSIHFV